MKTKSLYPIITTEKFDESLAFYTKVLDYQVKHEANTAVGRMVVLANDSNYQIELMENIKKLGLNAVASGLYGLRMNVDDIEEAKKEFEANGCEILMQPMETSIGKNMIVKDVNGVSITVIQHIHKA